MPNIDRCPRCSEKITAQDVANDVLYEQFCETEPYNNIQTRNNQMWYLAVFVFFVALFWDPLLIVVETLTGYGATSLSVGRFISVFFMLAGLGLLGSCAYFIMYKESKLFEEFKKSRAA